MSANQSVTRAVVLAAGRGSRLESERPKPLERVLGLPLLSRTLHTLRRGGVDEAYVVVGYQADQVRRGMEGWIPDGLRVHWVENPDWQEPNGLSVLAAAELVDGPFLLTMTDHVFSPEAVRALIRGGTCGGVNLAVDYDLAGVLDMDDATKVRVRDGRIQDIGKELDEYQAVDTGVFLASPALFDAIRRSARDGDASLSGGVRRLASAGAAGVTDIGDLTWQDVDTPRDRVEARRRLLFSLRKETDGPVARYFNRPLSGLITSVLVRTSVTANQVSVSTLIMSVVGAVLASTGSYTGFLAAAVLFQLASVVDGVDGEIAKLKFMESERGEWIDTLCDNLGYLAFLTGLLVGTWRGGYPDIYLHAGALGLVAAGASIANLTLTVSREQSSGSFLAVEYGYEEGTGIGSRIMRVLHFLGKRDFLAFFALLLAALGRLPLALALFGAGATVFLFPATLKANLTSWARQRRSAVVSSSEA